MDKEGNVKLGKVQSFLTSYCGFVIDAKFSKIKDEEGKWTSVRSLVVV